MKKITTLFAAAVMAVSASAQTVAESKTFDNVYVGINAGVATKTTGHASWLEDLVPNVGLRIGRNFTPVFGLAAESNVYFKETSGYTTGTIVNYINTSLLGTVNLINWFGGYPGAPRTFEVSALYGLGWGHRFTNRKDLSTANFLTSKVGLDFAFNLGKQKAWQLYFEPSLNYALNGNGYEGVKYNQEAQYNKVLADKDKQINSLHKALEECQNKPAPKVSTTVTNLQPTVIFGQGKSSVDAAQYAPIELIANYMKNHKDAKVEIRGYASPEGSAELNARLSQARADAVRNILIKRYKISADRLTAKGMGATDKLFEQVEFNRVATFNDVTKD